jgi:transposase
MLKLQLNYCHCDFRIWEPGLQRVRGLKMKDIPYQLEVTGRTAYIWAFAWHEFGVCGQLVGHKGGHPLALRQATRVTAIEAASAGSMTLGQIAQRIESVHGEPVPRRMCTLSP